jgi:hypothetical protein
LPIFLKETTNGTGHAAFAALSEPVSVIMGRLSLCVLASWRETDRAATDHQKPTPCFRAYSLHKPYCIMRLVIFLIGILPTNFADEPEY